MDVLLLTVFLSLCLAVVFIAAFTRFALKPPVGSAERDALLPLLEDSPSDSSNRKQSLHEEPKHERTKDHH